MTQWWLVHGVGDADLGVSSDQDNQDRDQQRELRQRVLHKTTDPVVLHDLLLRLGWDAPTTGELSPLANATNALPFADPVRLVLVATTGTLPTATGTLPTANALAQALSQVPDVFNRELTVAVVPVEGTEHSAGLAEDEVAAALTPYLDQADENDHVLITWGSGSTQLTLGLVEAAIQARLRWLLVNILSPVPAERYVRLDPSEGLTVVDPLVPLVRRWRYHDLLAELVDKGETTVTEELRQEVQAARKRWREAHVRPTAENLRSLMTDALMRGDATSGFAVRAYVLKQYQQLLKQENPPQLDLESWAQRKHSKAQRKRGKAQEKRGTPTLGEILKLIGEERVNPKVNRSKVSTSGRWLSFHNKTVEILNTAGKQSSHKLAPPPAKLRRSLREHLAAVPADESLVSDPTELLPAMGAWYVTIVGKNATQPKKRPHPLQEVAESGADPEVASYLGVKNPTPEDRRDQRYLVLGTDKGSEHDAVELTHRVNAASGSEVAVADTVPAPAATPPFDTETAYALLRDHFQRVRTDVGALVLVPTGPKPLVLPLLMAGLRLAAEEGIPLFLRQLASNGMHLLPVRFGADHVLLGLARHALDILELDVAARLLGSCNARDELAGRADQLSRALRCADPEHGANWPPQLPCTWSRQDRATGLVAQRVDMWAELAKTHQDPAHGVRAVMGAHAVLESSIRSTQPKQPGENYPGDEAWKLFTKKNKLRCEHRDHHAQALCALSIVRNKQPISHGDGLVQDLSVMISQTLGSRRPVSVAQLLCLVTAALRDRFGDVCTGNGTPSLSTLLAQLRADVGKAEDAELARLARSQAGTRRVHTNLLGLLGRTALETEAPSEPEQ